MCCAIRTKRERCCPFGATAYNAGNRPPGSGGQLLFTLVQQRHGDLVTQICLGVIRGFRAQGVCHVFQVAVLWVVQVGKELPGMAAVVHQGAGVDAVIKAAYGGKDGFIQRKALRVDPGGSRLPLRTCSVAWATNSQVLRVLALLNFIVSSSSHEVDRP